MDIQTKIYSTKDLNEAAFLLASDCKLNQTNNIDGITYFQFDDEAVCLTLSNSYWNRTAMVNAKVFTDSLRSLKGIIFRK